MDGLLALPRPSKSLNLTYFVRRLVPRCPTEIGGPVSCLQPGPNAGPKNLTTERTKRQKKTGPTARTKEPLFRL